MNLAELVDRTSVDALDHLERDTTIPVVDGLQAQGDLIVIPFALLDHPLEENANRWVPAEGVHLVAGLNGRNPHVLVADPGTCRWSPGPDVAVVENTAPVYLLHPEHGGTGIAAGRWLIRRQRSASGLVAD
jgi:hypothetical protein